MKTVVTGGTGFIGSHLVRELLNRGDQVRVFALPGDDRTPIDGLEVEVCEGDVRDFDAVARALRGADRLYHLAGMASLWAPDPGVFDEVNHLGTLNVLRAAGQTDTLERIVYTSSATVLAPSNRNDPTYYHFLNSPVEAAGPYCRSKLMAGRAALAASCECLPVVIVCPTAPIGPGDPNITPPTQMILNVLNGRVKGAIYDCKFNLVDVRDVAVAHIKAEELGQPGRIYPLNSANLMLSDLLALVKGMTGLKVPRRRIPYTVALSFAYLNELVADHITGAQPIASVTGVRLAKSTFWFDNRLTTRDLNVAFRPVEESLYATIADLLARGLVTRPVALKKPADPVWPGA